MSAPTPTSTYHECPNPSLNISYECPNPNLKISWMSVPTPTSTYHECPNPNLNILWVPQPQPQHIMSAPTPTSTYHECPNPNLNSEWWFFGKGEISLSQDWYSTIKGCIDFCRDELCAPPWIQNVLTQGYIAIYVCTYTFPSQSTICANVFRYGWARFRGISKTKLGDKLIKGGRLCYSRARELLLGK